MFLKSRHLRIVAIEPFHVIEILVLFRVCFPHLKITVTVPNSRKIFESLLSFEVDVADYLRLKKISVF